MRTEKEFLKENYPLYFSYIDIEARHVFCHQLSTSKLKTVAGFNHYAACDYLINPTVSNRYDVCGMIETWEHVMLCPCMFNFKNKFLSSLQSELNKFNKSRN